MTLQERLNEYLREKSLTFRDFERMCNLSNGTAARLRETTRKSTFDRIAISCDLNIDWLLTGEGEMLVEGKDTEGSLSSSDETGLINKVPLIPASAFAGGISGFAPDSIMLKDCEMIIPPVDGAQCAITITGDSMEPDFHNGSIAFLRLINESAFIPWGHVMVIDTENGAFIKTIYPDIDDEAYIWAKSINPKYPPIHIPKASIFRIFRVLGTSRIFTTM